MRQDVYRAAFEEANAELTEILTKFEQLRQRKERIEKVVEMLKPMAGVEAQTAVIPLASEAPSEPMQVAVETASLAVHTEAEQVVEPMQRLAEPSSDPFQRRIDSALGLSGGVRDSREFGRRFSGGVQRG
jgi:hypothetical protein